MPPENAKDRRKGKIECPLVVNFATERAEALNPTPPPHTHTLRLETFKYGERREKEGRRCHNSHALNYISRI